MPVSPLVHRLRRRLRSERGFTLIEMLVASAIGLVVLTVMLGLLDSSQTASSRVAARVDGTQRGRVAMEQVTQRLRSQICLGAATPLIVGDATSPTDANSVTFYSDLGNGSDFLPEKRRIYVSGTDLKERIIAGAGLPPNTTFTATPRDRTLMQNIKPVVQNGVNLAYFRYYTFDTATPPQPTVEVKPPLVAADSGRIVQVVIAFSAGSGKEARVDTNFVNGVYSRAADPGSPDPNKRGHQCS
jgi:prepilin-type N-terminal cleavage/methylation domain-containing protein